MKRILSIVFCTAVFIAGTGVGLSVKVLMARGAPVIEGGGELLLLLALPACVVIGFNLGIKRTERRRR